MRFFIYFVFSLSWIPFAVSAANCNTGIISRYTKDVVLTASSEYASQNKTYDFSVSRAVLNYTEFTSQAGVVYMGGWTAATNDQKQFIQIQLQRKFQITGITTQGKDGCCQEWVREYQIFYGPDCNNLKVLDSGKGTSFRGNTDENTMVTQQFQFPVNASCIRIKPINWNNKISMRLDLLGCPAVTSSTTPSITTPLNNQKAYLPGVCNTNLLTDNTTLSPSITASSEKSKGSSLVSFSPSKALLYAKEEINVASARFQGGWSPQTSDKNQYIQVEFANPAIIRGLVTQGKNGYGDEWVTKYKVFYSMDCKTWNVSGGYAGLVFAANKDKDTPVSNILICPTEAKCVRIQPLEWNNEIGMRFDVIGCSINGAKVTSNQNGQKMTTPNRSLPSTVATAQPTTTTKSLGGTQCTDYLFSNQPYNANVKMSASSELMAFDRSADYSADRGRLHSTETSTVGVQLHGGWSAAFKDTSQYLQVELPKVSTITGVVTQGKNGMQNEWVKNYRILYSTDCKNFNVVNGPTGTLFNGNSDQDSEVMNKFPAPVNAKCIRINPESWENQISMRMDLIGCFGANQQTHMLPGKTTITTTQSTVMSTTVNSGTSQAQSNCKMSLINNSTLGTSVNLTASSTFHNPTSGTDPKRALLDLKAEHKGMYTLLGGWSPAIDGNQYIQATFDKPHLINSITTQGMDGAQKWVKKYTVEYSEDCVNWQQLINPKEFTANTDTSTKITQSIKCPVFAKCVRIHPTEWNQHSGLRFDISGCEVEDSNSAKYIISSSLAPSTTTPTTTSTSASTTTSTRTTAKSPSSSTSTTTTTPNSSPSTTTLSSSTSTTTTPSSTTSSTSSSTKPTTTTTTPISSTTTPTTKPSTTISTTKKPTTPTPTHITHKIFPTGTASNYDKRDPLDCKRALLIDPCTIPLVRQHCFYSCNKGKGSSVSSSLITPSSQTTTIAPTQSTKVTNSVVQSTSNLQASSPNTMSTSVSSSSMATKSLGPSLSFLATKTQQSIMPTTQVMTSSSQIPTSPPTSSVTPHVSHITHHILPTGQSPLYNKLDPLDCKRALLVASCNVRIVAAHCKYSCAKPSSVVPSSASFPTKSTSHNTASTPIISSNSAQSQMSSAQNVISSNPSSILKTISSSSVPHSSLSSNGASSISIQPSTSVMSIGSISSNIPSGISSVQSLSTMQVASSSTSVVMLSSSVPTMSQLATSINPSPSSNVAMSSSLNVISPSVNIAITQLQHMSQSLGSKSSSVLPSSVLSSSSVSIQMSSKSTAPFSQSTTASSFLPQSTSHQSPTTSLLSSQPSTSNTVIISSMLPSSSLSVASSSSKTSQSSTLSAILSSISITPSMSIMANPRLQTSILQQSSPFSSNAASSMVSSMANVQPSSSLKSQLFSQLSNSMVSSANSQASSSVLPLSSNIQASSVNQLSSLNILSLSAISSLAQATSVTSQLVSYIKSSNNLMSTNVISSMPLTSQQMSSSMSGVSQLSQAPSSLIILPSSGLVSSHHLAASSSLGSLNTVSSIDMSSFLQTTQTNSAIASSLLTTNSLNPRNQASTPIVTSSAQLMSSSLMSTAKLQSSLSSKISSSTPIVTSSAQTMSSSLMSSAKIQSSLSSKISSSSFISKTTFLPSSSSVFSSLQMSSLQNQQVSSHSIMSTPSPTITMLSSDMSSISPSMTITCGPVSNLPSSLLAATSSGSFSVPVVSSTMSHFSILGSSSGLITSYSQSQLPTVQSTCYLVPIAMTPVTTVSTLQSLSIASISPSTSSYASMSTATPRTTSTTPKTTTTTPQHVTHITLPVGVASNYDNRDPVGCKRTLKAFSCSVQMVATYCHYSCMNQTGK